MNQIKKAGDFTNDIERDIEEIRAAAAGAQSDLRVLRELEMGWVAGGSDVPQWM